LIKLAWYQERYATKIKQCSYLTIKATKGTKWFKRHNKAQRNINSLRIKLTREKLDKIIDDFYETVYTEEVDWQMRGIVPLPADLNLLTIKYELKEQAKVA
jgi:hypothetical protein